MKIYSPKAVRNAPNNFVTALLVLAFCLTPSITTAQNNPNKFQQIQNIIVIYQENWSFDSLYGLFPGANGLFNSSQVSLTQRDRLTGQPYSSQTDGAFVSPQSGRRTGGPGFFHANVPVPISRQNCCP